MINVPLLRGEFLEVPGLVPEVPGLLPGSYSKIISVLNTFIFLPTPAPLRGGEYSYSYYMFNLIKILILQILYFFLNRYPINNLPLPWAIPTFSFFSIRALDRSPSNCTPA